MSDKRPPSRRRTELLQRAKSALGLPAARSAPLSGKDTLELIEELHVYHIELEMQNDELRRTQVELEQTRDRFRALYDAAPVAYLTLGHLGQILEVNLTAVTLLETERARLIGRPLRRFVGRESQDRFFKHRRQILKTGQAASCEIAMTTARGTEFYAQLDAAVTEDEQGRPVNLLIMLRDVTTSHALSEQVTHQATHDGLTNLVNRSEFARRLERVLESARRHDEQHALCYLDLDQFKIINDTNGHLAGDQLLREISMVLQNTVRKRDTLARLGGDEFAVLVEHCTLEQAKRLADTLRDAVDDFRFRWQGRDFSVGVSVGLVPIGAASRSIDAVLAEADAACYAAKDDGRNRTHIYRPDDALVARQSREMHWAALIQEALEADLFSLVTQPIVPVDRPDADGDMAEVLLRMQGPDGTRVGPNAFLPAAKRFHLIGDVDRWVVEAVFGLLGEHPYGPRLSINISGHSIASADFSDFLVRRLDETGVSPEKLCFEVTETAALTDLDHAVELIKVLRERGCQLALDDFGSGLSSFTALKKLPVDFVKIGHELIEGIPDSPVSLVMVRSICGIAHVMGIKVIVEHVETETVRAAVVDAGADYIQGFLLGEPRPIGELMGSRRFKPWVATGRSPDDPDR